MVVPTIPKSETPMDKINGVDTAIVEEGLPTEDNTPTPTDADGSLQEPATAPEGIPPMADEEAPVLKDEDTPKATEYAEEDLYKAIPEKMTENDIADLNRLCDHVNKDNRSKEKYGLMLLRSAIIMKGLAEDQYEFDQLDKFYKSFAIDRFNTFLNVTGRTL